MITASGLKPFCAYPRELKKLKSPDEAAVAAWLERGDIPSVKDPEAQQWIDRVTRGVTGETLRMGLLAYNRNGGMPPIGRTQDEQKWVNLVTAAPRGRVLHEAIETWIRTGALPPIADPEIQGWADLLVAELPHQGVGWIHPKHLPGAPLPLVEEAWGLWDDGRYTPVSEPAPHVYVATGEYREGTALLTAGRADLAFTAGHSTLVVLDWKTGKWPVTPAEMNLQVNAAGMALAQTTGMPWYLPGIYYARDGYFDWGEPVRMGSPEHHARWADVREAALLPPEPRPGPHCQGCWDRKICPSGGGR